jgi:hypothetical protein
MTWLGRGREKSAQWLYGLASRVEAVAQWLYGMSFELTDNVNATDTCVDEGEFAEVSREELMAQQYHPYGQHVGTTAAARRMRKT